MELNARQKYILRFLEKESQFSQREIQKQLKNFGEIVSKVTILRDLELFLRHGFLERTGKGRATQYQLAGKGFFNPTDIESYFQKGPDERERVHDKFDFEIFQKMKKYPLFIKEEFIFLENLNEQYRKNLAQTDSTIIQKEFERLIIEFSWKSSQFEGNTYTLLETEILLTEGKESPGHTKEEAMMILNHKKVLDYIRSNVKRFQKLSIREIENIHTLLMKDLPVLQGLRSRPVGITGTRYKPLDNIHQIREALEKLCELVNMLPDAFSKALAGLILISYIQPFNDGNKRTGRLISNAILLAYGNCPLSYRNVSESEYKKIVLFFYEQQNLYYLKKLFIKQIEFSVNTYFQ